MPEIEIVPIPHSPDFKTRFVVITKAETIRQVDGVWWVHFEGSRESMAFGSGEKPFQDNQPVRITFEGLDAKPSKSPV